MNSQAIALLIAAGGLILGVARLAVSILSYRLDARRDQNHTDTRGPERPKRESDEPASIDA